MKIYKYKTWVRPMGAPIQIKATSEHAAREVAKKLMVNPVYVGELPITRRTDIHVH